MLRYDDEKDLQRKIITNLNKQGFHFDIVPHGFDAIDVVDKIYIEVKKTTFAPAQILYAIAKGNVERVKYIGLATAYEIRIYKSPAFDLINEFARSIDKTLHRSPSSITKQEFNDRAFELLGDCYIINDYKTSISLQHANREIFIDDENLARFKDIFEKYSINPVKFLTYIADIYSNDQRIVVNNDGRILNINTGKFFANVTGKKKTSLTERLVNVDDIYSNYKPIRDKRDKEIIESLRIQSNDIKNILHQVDRFESMKNRRARGRFFTKDVINNEITEIVESIDPDYIIEPYIGAGSLIESVVDQYPGAGNDINSDFIQMLRKKHEGREWSFVNVNMFTTATRDLLAIFKIPSDANILFLTNPPFGSSRGKSASNRLVSKKQEVSQNAITDSNKIDYGDLGDTYGRGDMVLPAIGRMIEIIKFHGNGYIATFSPLGIYCGRARYNKLFMSLLRDFEFVSGDIFSGKHFNSVSKNKPIAFAVWRYAPGTGSTTDDVRFLCDRTEYLLKRTPLLKDGWEYNKFGPLPSDNDIGVQCNDRFNTPNPKMFHVQTEKGGSSVTPDHVKIELNLPNVPSELVYALWSVTVGTRSLTDHPLWFDNAYVHLPDFTRHETMEILTLALMSTILTETKSSYCQGRIGFIGVSRIFKFGNKRLTDGATSLLTTYGSTMIHERSVHDIFSLSRTKQLSTDEHTSIIKQIKKEIQTRLDAICYWSYIPIPMGDTESDDD